LTRRNSLRQRRDARERHAEEAPETCGRCAGAIPIIIEFHHEKEWINMATTLTKENFQKTVEQGVSLVDFWAPWCGPCRMQEPIIEELAREIGDRATIAKLNVDDEPELASRYGVMSIPTLILFKDGQPVDKLVGLQSKETLKARLQKLL